MKIKCPNCKDAELKVVPSEVKMSLVYQLVESWSIISEERLESATLMACYSCGWFDTITDRNWKDWDISMKEFLNGEKEIVDPFAKWRLWNISDKQE